MTDALQAPRRPVAVTGLGVLSALGRGPAPLLAATASGTPAFATVTRFDLTGRAAHRAAHLPGTPRLATALLDVIGDALEQARLIGAGGADPAAVPPPAAGSGGGAGGLRPAEVRSHPRAVQPPALGADGADPAAVPPAAGSRDGVASRQRRAGVHGGAVLPPAVGGPADEAADRAAATGLLLALHSDAWTGATVQEVTAGARGRYGIGGGVRTYTGACVASSTALADAAAAVAHGRAERFVVAAGYLVEPDTFAVFDAGSALSRDGHVRPFSRDRRGLLLGDAVVAVVVESQAAARARGAAPLAVLAGWGRSGDGYHVSRPEPGGSGLARAAASALARSGVSPDEVGYVNANGTGSVLGDASESRALHTVFGARTARLPVSSTKSVHGHALEASALLEFAVTVLALRAGRLPVNAGYLGPADDCPLPFVLTAPHDARPRYALTLNAAFGGANTALLIEAA